MNFNDLGTRDQASDIPSSSRNMEITCHTNEGKDIAITLSINGSRCYISFHAQTQLKEGFVAQILPIYQNGPQYEQSREIFVLTLEHKIPLDIDVDHLSGIILILTVPAYSGEYDTVEIFTPPNAPWELCGSGPTVFRKETQEPINGRQNFPPTFTYDGSLFIVGAEYSLEKPNSEPTPFILRNSCIATDWVDYWYTVATQIQ